MFKWNKPDTVPFGDKHVEVPKLTIEKWKQLFSHIESLPSLIVSVLSARHTPSFTAALTAAAELALDEVVELVSVITDEPKEWIEKNVDLVELIIFLSATVRKNNLAEAAKKFQDAFGKWMANPDAPSPSTNG